MMPPVWTAVGRALGSLTLCWVTMLATTGCGGDPKLARVACDPSCVEGAGRCVDGVCVCEDRFAGAACEQCAEGFVGFPDCTTAEGSCAPDACGDHGACQPGGGCVCAEGYAGDACDACAQGFVAYPDCVDDPCDPDPCGDHGACEPEGGCACDEGYVGAACEQCAEGFTGFPDCVPLCDALACAGETPLCDEAGARCVACLDDVHCPDSEPICLEGACVACLDSTDPVPGGVCEGVCGLVPPECVNYDWQCVAPGFEGKDERSCDGFDNDCDGDVDEEVCDACEPAWDAILGATQSVWDIDFDYACRAYMTSLISGADFTRVVDPDGTVSVYYGNANQNMGFGLVDPNPGQQRVVVLYSCCPGCGCTATNGLTLLYTCDPGADPDCGCAGQDNCPGFLNAPFLPAGSIDTNVNYGSGYPISTPTGLAAGPGQTYFVGNLRPTTCTNADACVPCDPEHPDLWCTTDGNACCDDGTLGRLAQFTLPEADQPPTWRVVRVFEDEAIIALATGRDNSVMVGTNAGNLYRYNPLTRDATLVQSWDGVVLSVTEDRRNGHWYVETATPTTLRRLNPEGVERPLPPGMPAAPEGKAVLQFGPDSFLYRLQGKVGAVAPLERYELPLWSPVGGPCSDAVLCEPPALCQDSVCVEP